MISKLTWRNNNTLACAFVFENVQIYEIYAVVKSSVILNICSSIGFAVLPSYFLFLAVSISTFVCIQRRCFWGNESNNNAGLVAKNIFTAFSLSFYCAECFDIKQKSVIISIRFKWCGFTPETSSPNHNNPKQ